MQTGANRCSNLNASQVANHLSNSESECKGKLNVKSEMSNTKRYRLHSPPNGVTTIVLCFWKPLASLCNLLRNLCLLLPSFLLSLPHQLASLIVTPDCPELRCNSDYIVANSFCLMSAVSQSHRFKALLDCLCFDLATKPCTVPSPVEVEQHASQYFSTSSPVNQRHLRSKQC